MKPRLHNGFTDTKNLHRFFHIQLLHIAQNQNLTVADGECIHRFHQFRPQALPFRSLTRQVAPIGEVPWSAKYPFWPVEFAVVDGFVRVQQPLAQQRSCFVLDDAHAPLSESLRILQLIESREQNHNRLLHGILGILLVAENAECLTIINLLVGTNQIMKDIALTVEKPLDE